MDDHLFRQYYAILLYDEKDEYECAIRRLTEHLESNPANAAAYNNRAVAQWEIGRFKRARADFAEAIRLAPADPRPVQHRGMFLQRMGEVTAALADFDAAVRLAPDDPYLRRMRGHARAGAGDLAGAAEDFGRAIAVHPQFAGQYLDRAAVYERLGQAALAEQDRVMASRLASPAEPGAATDRGGT